MTSYIRKFTASNATIGRRIRKFTLAAASLMVLGVTLAPRSAEAVTNETCTVGTVWFAPVISVIGANTDILAISCSNDGTTYYLAVGTPTTGSCFAAYDAVKSMEAIGLTARVTGAPATILYYTANCPGLNNVRVITEIGM